MVSSIPASDRADLAPGAAPAVHPSRGRRTRRMALGGGVFVLLLVVIALAAPVIAPHDPVRQSLRARLLRSRESAPAPPSPGGWVARVTPRHILPNVLSSLVVIATLELARAIVLEATLSFLGLGVQPPTPSWGGMVHEGREYLDSAWWISTAPGIVLMLTSIVVSRTGDWLRDLLDPTLRGE